MPMSESVSHPQTNQHSFSRPSQPVTAGDMSADLEINQSLLDLAAQLPRSPELQQIRFWADQLNWLNYIQRCSRLLMAVVEPTTLTIRYANDYFYEFLGLPERDDQQSSPEVALAAVLSRLVSEADHQAVHSLYRRHILHLVLRDFYHIDAHSCRLLEAPVMVSMRSSLLRETRYVEFWLRSEQLRIQRRDPHRDEFADLQLGHLSPEAAANQLANLDQLQALEQRLCLENYEIEGQLLLEGLDVTPQETIRRITQLLIDRDSILHSRKFRQVNRQMRSLFRAWNTVIASIESDEIRLFMGSVGRELETTSYPLSSLQGSFLMQAVMTNRVIAVADLTQDEHTNCGKNMLELGVRSLLLIPLVSQVGGTGTHAPHTQVIGLVGVVSDQPNNFDALDCRCAEQLIPAFTSALTSAQRQLVQQRFITNIHPSVEWKFLEEAERRSLGLPAEPIVFTNVYPLYGISDIRGSSEERNRAIQADLLEQLHLGLAVVEAACQGQESALGEQLRLDLLERIQNLQERLTVDAEVSELRYLHHHLEVYFDYFKQCGEAAVAAIATYQAACANDHQCVYHARANYDQTIGRINAILRETWERWQARMQQVSPHYCDIETTDGIDHMIYAGASIDPKFGSFQLRSLRYEQLRAICDCARAAMRLQAEEGLTLPVVHLVLVQDSTVDIFHDETTEKLFDVRGTRDTRYEIVKKRIDKAIDEQTQTRITQPGMMTLVYSTNEEWDEYQQYLRYLMREGWIDDQIEHGTVEPLQGVTGLKFARVRVQQDMG
ncbi:GAF domain-containing protein [Pantanalinema sp. GBBB05]|uniref:GAF domain-containing protein n=1 Tax=Pantanalinema sp. GBBB05 TaxID=2604139 RepID=UPI003D8166C1